MTNTAANTQLYDEKKIMMSVDTSTHSMTVALSRGNELLGEITSLAERNHSIYLVSTLQRLMQDNEIRPKDLAAFTVGVGPGSYTGVRIGVTVAKTFAWSHKLALLSVSTLEAMALGGADRTLISSRTAERSSNMEPEQTIQKPWLSVMDTVLNQAQASEETTWIVPLIDARRGQVYTALYEASPEGWRCVQTDGIRLMDSWVKELAGLAASGHPFRIIFTGELELHSGAVHSFAGDWSGIVLQDSGDLFARYNAELGRLRWQQGITEDVHLLVPNYTQLAEAEAKLLAKKS